MRVVVGESTFSGTFVEDIDPKGDGAGVELDGWPNEGKGEG